MNTARHAILRQVLTAAVAALLLLGQTQAAHAANATQPVVIDTLTDASFATPAFVVLSPNGNRAFVANYGGNTVSVINTNTNKVVAAYDVDSPYAMTTVARNGSVFLYVASYQTSQVKVFDAINDQAVANIPGFATPSAAATSPNNNQVYVANNGNKTVSVIDTETWNIIGTIAVDTQPSAIAFSPDGTRAYVSNRGADSVSVINTAIRMAIKTVGTGSQSAPFGLAATPDGKTVYINLAQENQVVMLDTSTNMLTGYPITVGDYPRGIAVSPDGEHVYTANNQDGTVSTISTATNAVSALPASVGPYPSNIALTPDGDFGYTPTFPNNSVSVLALAPPDAPGGGYATAGNERAAVKWTAPSSAAPITGYTATASPGGHTCTSTSTNCTIYGLTNGTAYTVTVTATSAVGTGRPSGPIGPLTPALQVQAPRDSKGQPPKAIKKTGTTVLTGKNARTNAGQRIRTAVRVHAPAATRPEVVKGRKGKVSIRTYGPGFTVVLTQSAPATDGYQAYRLRTVYRAKK